MTIRACGQGAIAVYPSAARVYASQAAHGCWMETRDRSGSGAKRHGPLVAAVLSGIFPGLGQLYNGQRLKALLFVVGAVLTSVGPVSPLNVNIDLDNPAAGMTMVLITAVPFLALALGSVIDAYRTARQASR